MSEILRCQHECAYCGWTGQTRDHVPALSTYWLGNRSLNGKGATWNRSKTIPACRECNNLLSNLAINSIRERAEYLSDVLPVRYKKLLNQPVWTEEEICELGPEMQRFVRANALKRQIVLDRLAHLGTIARFGADTPSDYWDRVSTGLPDPTGCQLPT